MFHKFSFVKGNVRVQLQYIRVVFFCQYLGAFQQAGQHFFVMDIADGTSGSIHQRPGRQWNAADQHGHGAFDFFALIPYDNPLEQPVGFLPAPFPALLQMPLRVPPHKCFKFFVIFGTDKFICVHSILDSFE